jgi:putative multicomponent Na+:H+ antiporter subunit B
VVFQKNPYHALVLRGILGAVAAMVYAVLGAADVALTEALVGTLLAITLYAVAVRSSLVLRLGVLKDNLTSAERPSDALQTSAFPQQLTELRKLFDKYHLRVELVPYLSNTDLQQALMNKEIHVTCAQPESGEPDLAAHPSPQHYPMTTRLRRIHEILQTEWRSSTTLIDIDLLESTEVHS